MAIAARAAADRWGRRVVRNLDLVALAVGVGVGLALDVPRGGLLIGAGGWLLQRAIAHADRGLVARAREPRSRLGLHLAEGYARIWLLAGAIVGAGAGLSRADGLTAAVCICASYTVAFVVKLLSGPPRPRVREVA